MKYTNINWFWPVMFIVFGLLCGWYTGTAKQKAYKQGIYIGFAAGIDTTQRILDKAIASPITGTLHCITYGDTVIHRLHVKPEFINEIYGKREHYEKKYPRRSK